MINMELLIKFLFGFVFNGYRNLNMFSPAGHIARLNFDPLVLDFTNCSGSSKRNSMRSIRKTVLVSCSHFSFRALFSIRIFLSSPYTVTRCLTISKQSNRYNENVRRKLILFGSRVYWLFLVRAKIVALTEGESAGDVLPTNSEAPKSGRRGILFFPKIYSYLTMFVFVPILLEVRFSFFRFPILSLLFSSKNKKN